MHRPTKWHERIEIDMNDEAVRIVSAEWKYANFDCYQENGNGECFCRNVYTSVYCGYAIAFPGEPFSRYDRSIAEEEDWGECNKLNLCGSREPTEEEKKLICDTYEGFNYVLNKWQGATIGMIFDILPFWKEHKEVELLCAVGYWKLAKQKGFYRLSDKKKKEVIKWLCNHRVNFPILNLKEILAVLKNKISDENYLMLCRVRNSCYDNSITMDAAKYIRKQAEKYSMSYAGVWNMYRDYKRLAVECDKDLTNDFWKYPNNLPKTHDRLLQQRETIRAYEQKQRGAAQLGKLSKLVDKLEQFNSNIDGYAIYFSGDFDDWNKQAEELHQCIVACDFISKMVNNHCRIAFIRKDNEPVATVELLEGNRIGQFYADELDRQNCLPSAEVKTAVEKWIKTLPILLKGAA